MCFLPQMFFDLEALLPPLLPGEPFGLVTRDGVWVLDALGRRTCGRDHRRGVNAFLNRVCVTLVFMLLAQSQILSFSDFNLPFSVERGTCMRRRINVQVRA